MTGLVHVRVRLFARQRELAGTRELTLEVATPATVEDAWTALVRAVPALEDGRGYVQFAVNGAYAEAGTVLAEGDEIAVIPPVSGGSGEPEPVPPPGGRAGESEPVPPPGGRADGPEPVPPPGGRWILELRPAPLPAGLGRELADLLATPADGAVVVFEGRTRATPGAPAPGEEEAAARLAGLPVEALEYEAFEPLVGRVFGQIAAEVAERFGVDRLAIVHAVGRVALGEASVVVVAVAPHRGPAFGAARFAMDEVKARAPIWKAEHVAGGHVWIGRPARTGPGAEVGG